MLKLTNDDWVIEYKEISREKGKPNNLIFDLLFGANIFSFTSDDNKEVIEWIHNLRKYLIFKAKFGNI
jgi:hypothetical protein